MTIKGSKTKKKPVGRPTLYNEEIAQEICDAIAATSRGLTHLCKDNPHWPAHSNIYKWMAMYPEFRDRYEKARANQAEILFDELILIADDSTQDEVIGEDGKVKSNQEFIQRSRLRVDTRKWILSKLLPKKYGDRLQTDTTVNIPDGDVVAAKIAEFVAQHAANGTDVDTGRTTKTRSSKT